MIFCIMTGSLLRITASSFPANFYPQHFVARLYILHYTHLKLICKPLFISIGRQVLMSYLLSFSLFKANTNDKPHIARLQEGCKETSLDIWLRRW